MSVHNILVVGTGAIGAFFASRFASVPGVRVSAICRSNYKAVNTDGIRITSPIFKDTTFRPAYTFANTEEAKKARLDEKITWDYFFVSTKVLPELGDPSALLEGLVEDGSSIVLSQNGLGIEQPYWRRFPKSIIISATTRTSVEQMAPNHIKHNHWTRTTIGPYTPSIGRPDGIPMDKTKQFASLLNAAGIPDVDILDHTSMQFARWHKIAINASMNPTAVLAGGPATAALALDDELLTHVTGVMQEVLDAAEKVLGKQIPASLPSIHDVLDGVKQDVSGSRPSMWLDWAAGRRVELEVILGEPLRQAKAVGVDMPRTQTLYALLRKAQEMREVNRRR